MTTWHEVLTDAVKPLIKDGFHMPVYLLPGAGLVAEADPGGHYVDGGQASRRACHQANLRGVERVYVVRRQGERLYLYATAERSSLHDNRFRSFRDPYQDPLHVARIVTSTVRSRLSPLAARQALPC